MHRWKTSEICFLKANIHLPDKEVAESLNMSVQVIRAARRRNGLIKHDKGNFQKGFEPWNKGVSYQAGGRSAETQFKKGHRSENVRLINAVFFVPDSNGKEYPFIKLAYCRAYPYQRYLFEQTNGVKLSANEIVKFKDGNTRNIEPENLIKITRAENVKLNANRKKSGETLRKTWNIAKTFNDYGYKKSWFKNR